MRLTLMLVASFGLGGCGGPLLQNAPKPDPAVVAGAAAALAGAATLADPAGAAKRQEENKPVAEKRPINVKTIVPASVLDHLDENKANKSSGSAAPSPPAKPVVNSDDGLPFDQPRR